MSAMETLPIEADHDTSSAVPDHLATHVLDSLHQAGKEQLGIAASTDSGLLIRVVTGAPSDIELAALIAVLDAASSSSPNPPHSPISSLGEWGAPVTQLRYGLCSAPAHFVNARYSR